MSSLPLHHKADVAVLTPQVRIQPVVQTDRRAGPGGPDRVRGGESLGDPVHLKGHFRMPSQDVPESLVGEPDLVSALIGETAHSSLAHRIPYRKLYRLRYRTTPIRSQLSLGRTRSVIPS